MGYISISLNHLQFPSLMFYNSQHMSFTTLERSMPKYFIYLFKIFFKWGCCHWFNIYWFLAVPCDLWDLGSQIRGWTWGHGRWKREFWTAGELFLVSIFIIIILKSFGGKLSVLLKSFFLVLFLYFIEIFFPCSFSWNIFLSFFILLDSLC